MEDEQLKEIPARDKLINFCVELEVQKLSDGLKEEGRQWIRDNILSINQVIQDGRHDVVFYPAVGRDALRVFLTFDPIHLLVVDSMPEMISDNVTQFQAALAEIGVVNTINEEGNKKTIKFELAGKQRTVTLIIGDAREVNLKALGMDTDEKGQPQVDILHIYAATGAGSVTRREDEDQKLMARLKEQYGDDWQIHYDEAIKDPVISPYFLPDDEKNAIVTPGFDDYLTAYNYGMVRNGGFLMVGERWLGNNFIRVPDEVAELLGARQRLITRRHPQTVLTSFWATDEDVSKMDRAGFIIQKLNGTLDVRWNEFEQLLEDGLTGPFFMLTNVEGGAYYSYTRDRTRDIEGDVNQAYVDLCSWLDKSKLLQGEQGERAKISLLRLFREKTKTIQEKYRRFFSLWDPLVDAYRELEGRLDRGEISGEEFNKERVLLQKRSMDTFGLRRVEFKEIPYHSDDLPFAAELVFSGEEVDWKRKLARDFAVAQFPWLDRE